MSRCNGEAGGAQISAHLQTSWCILSCAVCIVANLKKKTEFDRRQTLACVNVIADACPKFTTLTGVYETILGEKLNEPRVLQKHTHTRARWHFD